MTQTFEVNVIHPLNVVFFRGWLLKTKNVIKMKKSVNKRSSKSMADEIKQATDIAKDPATFSMVTYAIMLALAMWGGLVRAIKEITRNEKGAWHIFCLFLAEMCVSGFVGTITFSLCLSSNLSLAYTGALTAISGYMGGRSLSVFEKIYGSWKGIK